MRELLKEHIPAAAVDYCCQLWNQYRFEFKIKPKRHTKIGDYSFQKRKGKHVITINKDLNPYTFLITYVHEVAHLVVGKQYRNRVKPHGNEWKQEFTNLMQPLLNIEVFPGDLLRVLNTYFKNPRASSYSYPPLLTALRIYDGDNIKTIDDIGDSGYFRLNKKVFQKGLMRRTRILCQEMSTGKKYLISKTAEVEEV